MKTGTKYDHANDNIQVALGISDERGEILREAMANECKKAVLGVGVGTTSQTIANLIEVCETVDEVGYACFLAAQGIEEFKKRMRSMMSEMLTDD